MSIPQDLKFTRDHEWARSADNQVTIGITAFAVEQLGDVTIVDFAVGEGDVIEQGAVFGTIESVKTVSDLYAPVSGKVLKLNAELDTNPELVNQDCYGKAWMIVIECDSEPADLMDAAAYAEHIA